MLTKKISSGMLTIFRFIFVSVFRCVWYAVGCVCGVLAIPFIIWAGFNDFKNEFKG